MPNLDLGLIGNCCVASLVDRAGAIVWLCLPRFDGDPIFHSLLGAPAARAEHGMFAIDLEGETESEQTYIANTAVLRTIKRTADSAFEISDFCPRYELNGRQYRPQSIVRRIVPLSGTPRIRVRMKPSFDYGTTPPQMTSGSNHIRYIGADFTVRLTTDAPIDYVREETYFNLYEPLSFILGPDEKLDGSVDDTALLDFERTVGYWKTWTHRLAIPFEWQAAVIRAAITLKLCTYEPTGAIVAAITMGIPESPDSGRTWDYRYCWIRDAYFVVRALNSLSAVRTLENYARWLMNVVNTARDNHIQPVYGIALEAKLTESIVSSLPGYRGMGPVRLGNQAYEHFQHDSYGNVVLGAAQAFLDQRLLAPLGDEDFTRLEMAGEQSIRFFDQPDAGMWELRFKSHVHTTSSLMCWVACDRLARIAGRLGKADRARKWRKHADHIKSVILKNAWSDTRKAFVGAFGGDALDAGVLLMPEVGFIDAKDPRFVATLAQIEKCLSRGPHMMRYETADDFGLPATAFNICAFWRVSALARSGRTQEAREIFEALLETRNHLGLLSEDTDPKTGEAWGNFPQTYSMVGIINSARLLSAPWETEV